MQTERQKEIISVALELSSQKGIQRLTIKNQSKKIEISKPVIYRLSGYKIHPIIII